jgi:hypothetical protein
MLTEFLLLADFFMKYKEEIMKGELYSSMRRRYEIFFSLACQRGGWMSWCDLQFNECTKSLKAT